MKKTILMSLATMFAFVFISLQVKAVPDNKAAVQKVYAAPNDAWVIPDVSPQWTHDVAKPADNQFAYSQETTTGMTTVVNNQASDKPKTKKAIIQWQKENGLHPDGIWGPACKAKAAANEANKKGTTSMTSDNSPDKQDSKNNNLINSGGASTQTTDVYKDVAIVQLK